MAVPSDISDHLLGLEKRLLDPEIRRSADQLALLLADDFGEIGSSGRIFDRAAIIADLKKEPGFDNTRTITDFDVRLLSSSIALVTYRIRENGNLRSSLWQEQDGHWRLVFHQGTRPT